MKMAKAVIDNVEYDLNELSENAKQQIANIQYVDAKIADLKNQIAALTAARTYYSDLLKKALPKKKKK